MTPHHFQAEWLLQKEIWYELCLMGQNIEVSSKDKLISPNQLQKISRTHLWL